MQDEKNVTAECHSCHESFSGDYIKLAIGDTGSGINPEQLGRIFDPFYTTKDVGKGTGMGLSTVHGIMHNHGGHVVVESSPDTGSTFNLLFPVVDAHAKTGHLENNIVQVASKQLSGGNILIVDDEISVGRFIGELLKGCGYSETVEADSRAALLHFERNPEDFDLVVTDQTMPGLSGVELAQAMMEIRPGLPVILCTGHSDQIDEIEAASLGISGYVKKPIETDEFLRLVGELLQAGKFHTDSMARM